MTKYMDITSFRNYLAAGHGRCYEEVRRSPARYRRDITRLCLEDTSFDMQCEGSRALYAYDLVMLYDDRAPFIKKTIKAFSAADDDDDSHQYWHLCDLVTLFAYEYGDAAALGCLREKYTRMRDMLMTRRMSDMLNRVCNNFEYVSINMLRRGSWDDADMIAHDLGAWFLKRRRTDREDLRWRFEWLWHEMNDDFGADKVKEHFAPMCGSSKEIRRFIFVMSAEDKYKPASKKKPGPAPDAETAIRMITDGTVSTRYEMVTGGFMRIEESEADKLADYVIKEPDEHKKSLVLAVFQFRRMKWPGSAEHLIGYTTSDNEQLRDAAINALVYARDTKAGEFARSMLAQDCGQYREEYFMMLINHYEPCDEEFLMQILRSIPTEGSAFECGWHGIALDILNADSEKLPDASYMWIYENSLCSCCRRNAAEVMIKRGIFPQECLEECLHDCNTDVRELAENNMK